MDNKPYHHGDLRKALIENGIEFINQYGEEKLSLRKIAEKCGVSNAAPYAHFKDKDDFINAMQGYVMDSFMDSLVVCASECKDDTQILSELGVCYVMFFYHNPLYFDFLFSRKNIRIRLSSDNNDIPPFELFRRTAEKVLGKIGISEKNIRYKTIAMWSLVHGLSALSAIPDIDINWESEVREIINSVDISEKN
jgi:AcrR family transcriptional regulator